MKHRKSITEYELVRGGQGRSGAEVAESAMRIFWAFLAVILAAGIGALIERVM